MRQILQSMNLGGGTGAGDVGTEGFGPEEAGARGVGADGVRAGKVLCVVSLPKTLLMKTFPNLQENINHRLCSNESRRFFRLSTIIQAVVVSLHNCFYYHSTKNFVTILYELFLDFVGCSFRSLASVTLERCWA